MHRFSKLHHVAMATSDLEGTIRFWRDLLGLRLVAGLGKGDQRQYFFQLGPSNLIAFFAWPSVKPLPEKDPGRPVTGPLHFDHIALAVPTAVDLWELYDRLHAADVWVSEVIDHGYLQSLYTYDPNGICIEVGYDPGEYDFVNAPLLIDEDPPHAALEGPEPQSGKWNEPTAPTPFPDRLTHSGEGRDMLTSGISHWSPSLDQEESPAFRTEPKASQPRDFATKSKRL
jgi:catechol 2,3-dioxygenase-like lactoylglutathione lyase family enzyme